MSVNRGPKIVRDGLVLCLDAADKNSYSGAGTIWKDLSSLNNNGTLTNGPTYSSINNGSVVFDGIDDYVTYIKLKKNITLLFMIEGFRKTYIFSSLNLFRNHPNLNSYVKELKKEKFDGWFTSIENKSSIEVALINDNSLFDRIKTEEFTRNWRNGNNLNNIITTKNWGTKYSICSIEYPIIFKINNKFQQFIEDYINYGLKSKFPYEHVLQVILQNATIYYHQTNFDGKIE